MKILVLSDTHKILNNAYAVLNKLEKKVDAVIHLGDNIDDAERLESQYKPLPFYYVSGNCDFASERDSEKTIAFNGVNFLLAHGHRHSVKWGLERLSYATEETAQIGLFGHTHAPCIEFIGNVTLINPGSISLPRNSRYPTYVIIEVCDEKKINATILEVKSNNNFEILKTRMFYAN